MNWAQSILSAPPKDAQAPRLIDAEKPERSISWRRYVSTVKAVAVGLRNAGVGKQDCVGLLSGSDIYYYVLGDAIIAASGIFAPIAVAEKKAEVVDALQAAKVQWLFASVDLLDFANSATEEADIAVSNMLVFDPPGRETYSGSHLSFSKLLQSNQERWEDLNAEDDPSKMIAFRLLTSGTTGLSKAAEISHAASIARLRNLDPKADLVQSKGGDRALHFLPLHHISGQIACSRAIAGYQTTWIVSPEFATDVPKIIDLVRDLKLNGAFIPPRFLSAIVDTVRSGIRSSEDLSTLNGVRVGGSTIDAELYEAYNRLFPDVTFRIAYGLTETGPVSGIWSGDQLVAGSVGFPATIVDIKVLDPETLQEVAVDVEGEICVAGGQNFSGYCGNEQATADALVKLEGKSYFRTGDKGHLSSKTEQLAITGRYKEIFKVKSQHVSPEEIEKQLLKHPAVRDAAVSSIKARDNANDSEVVAYVVRRDEHGVAAQEIVKFVADGLSSHKAPTGGVFFCKSIPRNAMRKVVRRELDELEREQGSAAYLDP